MTDHSATVDHETLNFPNPPQLPQSGGHEVIENVDDQESVLIANHNTEIMDSDSDSVLSGRYIITCIMSCIIL